MSALATIDSTDLLAVIPAPGRVRPVRLAETRPRDRIAFRGQSAPTLEDDDDDFPLDAAPRQFATQLPDPMAWCGALVRTCVEVLLGARAPAQLARWLTADLYASLSKRAVVGQPPHGDARRVSIVKVHTHPVDDAHYEASVVLHDGRRVRAAAIRIEVHRNRWRATALEIG